MPVVISIYVGKLGLTSFCERLFIGIDVLILNGMEGLDIIFESVVEVLVISSVGIKSMLVVKVWVMDVRAQLRVTNIQHVYLCLAGLDNWLYLRFSINWRSRFTGYFAFKG